MASTDGEGLSLGLSDGDGLTDADGQSDASDDGSSVGITEPEASVVGRAPLAHGSIDTDGDGENNFYTVNGAVLVPAFGDAAADAHAARVIGEQFPDRVVEQVPLRQLAIQGGGMHCATQQVID